MCTGLREIHTMKWCKRERWEWSFFSIICEMYHRKRISVAAIQMFRRILLIRIEISINKNSYSDLL